jgi:hypothetical protein
MILGARGVEHASWDDVQSAFEAMCTYADANAGAGARWAQFVQPVWRAITASRLRGGGRRARQLWGRETVLVNTQSVGDRREDNERRGAMVVDWDLAS